MQLTKPKAMFSIDEQKRQELEHWLKCIKANPSLLCFTF